MNAKADTIHSEDDFLELVDRHFTNQHPHMLLGRGDDCAELLCPARICVSSDLFLEDVHFRRAYFSFEEIGYKALAVNISDLAACGGLPLGFNLNLMLPKNVSRSEVNSLLQGMAALAQRYNLPLIGGDLSSNAKLGLCLTVWGAPADFAPGELAGFAPDAPAGFHHSAQGPFLRRGNVGAGDVLFLLGGPSADKSLNLGMARTGLQALEKWGRQQALARYPKACLAHLQPEVFPHLGMALAKLAGQRPKARLALMDVSDGLSRDLPRLLGQGNLAPNHLASHQLTSSFGANIDLPLNRLLEVLQPELLAYCCEQGLDPWQHAFAGGEDYLLLGACSEAEFLSDALAELPHTLLLFGQVNSSGQITLNSSPLNLAGGFDHFGA